MAYSIPHNYTRQTGGYSDPFGDGVQDEPFSMGTLNRDDTKTFITTTSGVLAGDPTSTHPLAGPSEAEALAADFRQHNIPPSFMERPSRHPTPSPQESTFPNPDDTMMNVPYRDDDSPHRSSSFREKSEASLVHNAADMGRSSTYQDLGT